MTHADDHSRTTGRAEDNGQRDFRTYEQKVEGGVERLSVRADAKKIFDEAAAEAERAKRPHLREALLTLDDLAGLAPTKALVSGLLYRNTLAQMSGDAGDYKTFLAVTNRTTAGIRRWVRRALAAKAADNNPADNTTSADPSLWKFGGDHKAAPQLPPRSAGRR